MSQNIKIGIPYTMKKVIILFTILLITVNIFAQSPQKLQYQAIVRNANNTLVANQNITVRIAIFQGSENGDILYLETHHTTTNANGLMTIKIGTGSEAFGLFSHIDWANGPHFIYSEIDPEGGTNYTISSIQQLLSVPYALYANEAGNIPENVSSFNNDANYISNTNCPTISICDLNDIITNLQNEVSSLRNTVQAQNSEINHLNYILDTLINGPFYCGTSTVKDHEGNVYNTVQIGNQCWTKENMRCTTSPHSGTTILENPATGASLTGKKAYYYHDDPSNAENGYGLLYNWCAAMDTFHTSYGETSTNLSHSFSCTFSGHRRGICPKGWHVPSIAEWTELTDYVSGQPEYQCDSNAQYIAKALASTSDWRSVSCECNVGHNQSENNATGFTALPSGFYNNSYDHSFTYRTNQTIFWSSSEESYTSGQMAQYRSITYGLSTVGEHYINKYWGASVRCLKD